MPATLTHTSRDGSGRFVTRAIAALWADFCTICGEPRARHIGLRPATGEPFCPITVVDGALADAPDGTPVEDLDGTSFDGSLPSDCIAPTRHEVGCDCNWGFGS